MNASLIYDSFRAYLIETVRMFMPCATVLQPISRRKGMTYTPSRNCLVTRMCRLRWFIPIHSWG